MADPAPLLDGTNRGANAPSAQPHNPISRHRRIHKEVGAVTGITFVDHPNGNGVVVSGLKTSGACAKSGVRIGDHVTKINGTKPTDRDHAVALCDAAWTADADGTDKNKDRLKFSLHRRTQDFAIGRVLPATAEPASIQEYEGIQPLQSGGVVGVEVIGGGAKRSLAESARAAAQAAGLLGTSKKVDDSGLVLEDAANGYGATIVSIAPDSPAHLAGLEVGLTIVSISGMLCPPGHKDVAKMLDASRAKKGSALVVCHLKKDKEDEHV